MTRDEVDALNAQDPTTPLTDDDIERMLAHYRSKEYLSESGGGWRPLAAVLELQSRRAARAADRERVRSAVREAVCAWLANNTPAETDGVRAIAGVVMGNAIANHAADLLKALALMHSATSVMQIVRDVIATVSSLSGEHYPQRAIEDIATRVAIALTGRTDA